MASSCFLGSILFSSPTNLSSRSASLSPSFPKNLACCSPSTTASRFASLSVSSIGSGSSRRLADSRRKVSEVRSMATTAAEMGKEDKKKRVEILIDLMNATMKLVESPYVDSIDWSRWHFFWVDERVVPKHHDDSNYKLACDGFLSKAVFPRVRVP